MELGTSKGLTWENAEWADGPALVKWLRETGGSVEIAHSDPNGLRVLYRWAHEQKAISFFAVDEHLTKACIPLMDIPEHIWIASPPSPSMRGEPYPTELRERALRMFKRGTSKNAIARELGVSARSVRIWIQRAQTP